MTTLQTGRLSPRRDPLPEIMHQLPAPVLTGTALVLAPLAGGESDPVWTALLAAMLSLGIAVASLRDLSRTHLALMVAPVSFMAVLVLAALAQTRPDLARSLAHPIWTEASALLDEPLPRFVSVEAFPPWSAIGASLIVFLAFMAGFLSSVKARFALILLLTLCLAATLAALWAIITHVVAVTADGAAATGPLRAPFGNRNHAASYYGAAALAMLAVALVEGRRSWRIAIRQGTAGEATRRAWIAGAAAFGSISCVAAALLTQSRGGIIIMFAVGFCVTAIWIMKMFPSRRTRLTALVIALVFLAGLAEALTGGVVYRIAQQGLADAGRIETYAAAIEMVNAFPITGVGAGAFATVLPAFRSPDAATRFYWERAHNDPLEFATEFGLPLAGAGLLLVCFVTWRLLRGIAVRRERWVVPLAAFAVFAMGGLHALTDFALQVPGFGAVWGAVVGIGLAQSVPRGLRHVPH